MFVMLLYPKLSTFAGIGGCKLLNLQPLPSINQGNLSAEWIKIF